MLVLSRKVGEEIVIDERIVVKLITVRGDKSVKLGFEAPSGVSIRRSELPPKGKKSDG